MIIYNKEVNKFITHERHKTVKTIQLKWNITAEQKAYSDQATVAVSRIITKAQVEKEAKANGLWDYRNNKIVEA